MLVRCTHLIWKKYLCFFIFNEYVILNGIVIFEKQNYNIYNFLFFIIKMQYYWKYKSR